MPAVLPANAQPVYQALLEAGASAVQAAAITANAIFESSLNPESQGMDTNGAYSRGLWQWNDRGAGTGVNWGQYITGNQAADIRSQVGLLAAQGGIAKAAGASPAAAAASFAESFEACAECGPGGYQTNARAAQATLVYQVAQTGSWGTGLAPLNQGYIPQPTGSTPATLTGWSLNPLTDIEHVFQDIGGGIAGSEKFFTGAARFFAMLIAAETWIRLSEVVLGVIVGSAGLALYAVVLAGEHPGLVGDLAMLVPGEGEVAMAAKGAVGAAKTGSAARTITGAAAGGQRARTAARGPSRPTRAAAGADVRRAAAQVTRTVRAAQPEHDEPPFFTNGDHAETARHRAAGRANRAYYRREMGPPPRARRRPPDRSDVRRRTP